MRLQASVCVRYKAHSSLKQSYATRSSGAVSGWTEPEIIQEDAGNVPGMLREVVGQSQGILVSQKPSGSGMMPATHSFVKAEVTA